MKLLTEFDDLVINSRKISEIFEEKVLKESGRAGNWVSVDQAIWFLQEVVGIEIGLSSLQRSRLSRPEVMLMAMYDEAGVLLRDYTK